MRVLADTPYMGLKDPNSTLSGDEFESIRELRRDYALDGVVPKK